MGLYGARSNRSKPDSSDGSFWDSFSDAFLRAGFTGRFREIHKFYNLEFKEKFKDIPSDTKFVILEHIESNLGSMLLDSYWPEDLR